MTAPTIDEQIAYQIVRVKFVSENVVRRAFLQMELDKEKAILATLQSIKDAGDDAGHELGLWPIGALAAVARLRSERDEFRKDAERFTYLQNIPVKDAQAFFWNYTSRKQRAAAIDQARNK